MIAPHADEFFPANLYTPEGELLAEGQSSILKEDKAVGFSSDFVPLYPVGTPLVIERIFEHRAVHRFTGQVFLSSKEHMRLINVEDTLLPNAEFLYCGKMAFPATLTTSSIPIASHRIRLPFLKKNQVITPSYPALITEMTEKQLECQLDLSAEDSEAFSPHQIFLLNPLGSIPLPPTEIRIEQSYVFGETSVCIFGFERLEPQDLQTLRQFLTAHMQKYYKAF